MSPTPLQYFARTAPSPDPPPHPFIYPHKIAVTVQLNRGRGGWRSGCGSLRCDAIDVQHPVSSRGHDVRPRGGRRRPSPFSTWSALPPPLPPTPPGPRRPQDAQDSWLGSIAYGLLSVIEKYNMVQIVQKSPQDAWTFLDKKESFHGNLLN